MYGPHGAQPAEPVGAPARLTTWQAVRQSWLAHPDWTTADHLAWLDGEGYGTDLLDDDPDEVIGRWLAEHRRTARLTVPPEVTGAARVYVVAGGDMVAVFDNHDAAGIQRTVMEAANLDTIASVMTPAQWATAREVRRRAPAPRHHRRPERRRRADAMTGPHVPPSGDMPASLAARPRDARRGLPIPPVNVHPDPDGGTGTRVDFTTINTSTSSQLGAGRRCSLCGESMEYWVAFLGTPRAAELLRYTDPPGHPECMRAALTLCPHIALARHRRARADRPSAGIMPPGAHGDKPDGWTLGCVDRTTGRVYLGRRDMSPRELLLMPAGLNARSDHRQTASGL